MRLVEPDEGNFWWRSVKDTPIKRFLGRHWRGEGTLDREIYLTDLTINIGSCTALLWVDGTETEIYSGYSKRQPYPIEILDIPFFGINDEPIRRYGWGLYVKDHQGKPWAYNLRWPGTPTINRMYWADGEVWSIENCGARSVVRHTPGHVSEMIPVWRDRDLEQGISDRFILSNQPPQDRLIIMAALMMNLAFGEAV